MANEFVARNGLIAQNNSIITGSLTVTGGVTGSFSGSGIVSSASYASSSTSASYALTASFITTAQTASYVLQAVSSSFASTASFVKNAQTASFLNTLNQDLTFNGNLTLNGTASVQYLITVYETASTVYSSGSNQLGDAASDTQTLMGTTIVTGSLEITGSTTSTLGFTGSLQGTASYVTGAIYTSTNPALSASYAATASLLLGSVTSASYAETASYVLNAVSASYAQINVSANATSNNMSAIVFSNANNVSFGLNGSTITATVASSLTNINLSAGTTSNNMSAVVFSNANGISFGLNGSTLTAAGVTYDYYNPQNAHLSLSSLALSANTVYVQPAIKAPNFEFDRVVLPVQYSNASNSSNSVTFTLYVGVYTNNANTLSLVNMATASYNITNSGTLGSYSLYASIKLLTIGWTSTFNASDYYMAYMYRAATGGGSGMTLANMCPVQINSSVSGIFGQAAAASVQSVKGLGFYSSAGNTDLPTNMAISHITGQSSAAIRPPAMYFINGTA